MKKNSLRTLFLLAALVLAACDASHPSSEIALPPTRTPTPTEVEIIPTHTLRPTDEAAPANSAAPPPDSKISGLANADVVFVQAVLEIDGTWTFQVTVQHPDNGWEDYADGWDVVTPDGTILTADPGDIYTRLLLHPHEAEQPFTRSQVGIQVPPGVTQVRVRAHDIVDGYGGREILVDLTLDEGPGFEVER